MAKLLASVDDERVTARFVRFLIAEGVIPPPSGGRAKADYGDDHMRGIRRYLRLRELGLSASRTKEIVAGVGGDIPVSIGPGLTLLIDPEKIGEQPGVDEIAGKIADAVHLIRPKDD